MDAAYYAIVESEKKSLDILPKRASMSESHYVPASKKVKCRQTIEKGSTTGGLRPYVTVKFRIISSYHFRKKMKPYITRFM